jgi:hypothetical protein
MNDETADEALKRSLEVERMMTPPDAHWKKEATRITARNVLHSELGLFKDEQRVYHLDEATRDRLLAHDRQDTAHTLLNTIVLMDYAWEARRSKARKSRWWWRGAYVASIALLIFILHALQTRPAGCRDGFTPTFLMFEGWVCTAGYRP